MSGPAHEQQLEISCILKNIQHKEQTLNKFSSMTVGYRCHPLMHDVSFAALEKEQNLTMSQVRDSLPSWRRNWFWMINIYFSQRSQSGDSFHSCCRNFLTPKNECFFNVNNDWKWSENILDIWSDFGNHGKWHGIHLAASSQRPVTCNIITGHC